MKQENKEILENFLKYCKEYLKLTTLPKIKLTNDKSKTSTLAHYSPDSNEILVYIKNRAIGDWLRSLAHELIHAKQNEKNELDDNSGKTGSKHENQANSIAGIIMRNFGKKYPKLYMVSLNEIQVNNPKEEIEVDGLGVKRYYKRGTDILHRIGGPAVEGHNGYRMWCQNDKNHRLDGPAIEYPNGEKRWYQNGELHRLDGPAIIWSDGSKSWYINNEKYSEEEFNEKVKNLNEIKVTNPKYDIKINRFTGAKEYYKKGTDILHRIGGPAVEGRNGDKKWAENGEYHRLDGPAIEDNSGYKEWYINGKEYSEQKFNEKIKELNNNEMINEVRKGISEKIKDIKNSNLQNEAAKYKKTGILLDDTIKAYESLIGEAEKHGLVKEVKYLNGKKDYYCSLKEKVNSKLEILESNLQPETKDDEIIENN